jgi:hypothetical protein
MDTPVNPIPKCPHCEAELPGVGIFNWQAGAVMIISVYCGACLKVLHMSVVPVMEQQEPPRVQIPS